MGKKIKNFKPNPEFLGNVLDASDVSKMLNVTKSKVYYLCQSDQIPHKRIGPNNARLIFSEMDVIEWYDNLPEGFLESAYDPSLHGIRGECEEEFERQKVTAAEERHTLEEAKKSLNDYSIRDGIVTNNGRSNDPSFHKAFKVRSSLFEEDALLLIDVLQQVKDGDFEFDTLTLERLTAIHFQFQHDIINYKQAKERRG
jgi:hypothetical protein